MASARIGALKPTQHSGGKEYPARRRIRAALRRAVAVGTGATALCFAGCEGSVGLVGTARLGGEAMPVSGFVCAVTEPEDIPTLDVPGTVEAELCGEELAWAAFELEEEASLRISVEWPEDAAASLDVVAPSDELIGQIGSEDEVPELTLHFLPGRYVLSVTRHDPAALTTWEWFTLSVTLVE